MLPYLFQSQYYFCYTWLRVRPSASQLFPLNCHVVFALMSFLLNLLNNHTTLLGLSCGNVSSSARIVCRQTFHECCHLLCIRIHLSTLKMFDYFLFSYLVYLGSTCKVFLLQILWSPATAFSTPVFSVSFCITFQFWSSYLSMFTHFHLH